LATTADFRVEMMPASAFHRIYSTATTQNQKGEPGPFCFNLVRGFDTRSLEDGVYRVRVAVRDTRANGSIASVPLTVANETAQ
jgi:hypothetical protein